MASILRWIVALPLAVLAVLFALAHRQDVAFTYSPFHEPVTLPLYALALGLLGAGIVMGAVATWIGMHRVRKERRAAQKSVKRLEQELIDANKRPPVTTTPPAPPATPMIGPSL
jgi:putative membrane protein